MTCLIPTDAATARATRQLSPLTIDVDIPLECSAAIASDASALTGSLTQTMPRGRDAPGVDVRDGDGREKKRWTHDLVVQGRVPDVAQLRRVEGVAIHARIDRRGAFEDVARAMVGTTRLTARERRR